MKNSQAGIFNCDRRYDKFKKIVENIKNGIFFTTIESDDSENLIKSTYNKKSDEISTLKKEIKEKEKEKKETEEKIKNTTKSKTPVPEKLQEELQSINETIKEKQKKILQLESITSYKGGMKKNKHRKTRKKYKTVSKYKYIKVNPRKTRKYSKHAL